MAKNTEDVASPRTNTAEADFARSLYNRLVEQYRCSSFDIERNAIRVAALAVRQHYNGDALGWRKLEMEFAE